MSIPEIRKEIIGQRSYLSLLQNCCITMALGAMVIGDSFAPYQI
ncbi:MAG: hypothetical protein ACE5EN_10815 [Nitrospinota bacterium]